MREVFIYELRLHMGANSIGLGLGSVDLSCGLCPLRKRPESTSQTAHRTRRIAATSRRRDDYERWNESRRRGGWVGKFEWGS